MNSLHAVLRALTQAMFAPLAGLPSWVALVVWSAAFGIVAAIAFRYTSNQAALRRAGDRMRVHLLALRLFRDELGVTLRSIAGLFGAVLLRLLHSLPPLAAMLVPFGLLVAQFAMWYEFAPLRPGASVLVELSVSPGAWAQYGGLELRPPAQVQVEAVHRDPARAQVCWRLAAVEASPQPLLLEFTLAGEPVAAKQIVIADDRRLRFVSPVRAGPGFWDRLLYPGEPAFASDSPIQRIQVHYATQSTPIFGWDIHWIVTFLVASIIAALLVKPIVKVQF